MKTIALVSEEIDLLRRLLTFARELSHPQVVEIATNILSELDAAPHVGLAEQSVPALEEIFGGAIEMCKDLGRTKLMAMVVELCPSGPLDPIVVANAERVLGVDRTDYRGAGALGAFAGVKERKAVWECDDCHLGGEASPPMTCPSCGSPSINSKLVEV